MTQLVRICLQCGRPEFDPWFGKIPWKKEHLFSGLENSMDCIVLGVTKSQDPFKFGHTLSIQFSFFFFLKTALLGRLVYFLLAEFTPVISSFLDCLSIFNEECLFLLPIHLYSIYAQSLAYFWPTFFPWYIQTFGFWSFKLFYNLLFIVLLYFIVYSIYPSTSFYFILLLYSEFFRTETALLWVL